MELKKSLHREAKMNKQKLRDHKAKKILQNFPRNDDCSIVTLLPDETVSRSLGESYYLLLVKYFKHFRTLIKHIPRVEVENTVKRYKQPWTFAAGMSLLGYSGHMAEKTEM